MSNRYITGNREQIAEYHFSDTSLGLQIIAIAVVLKELPLLEEEKSAYLPNPLPFS